MHSFIHLLADYGRLAGGALRSILKNGVPGRVSIDTCISESAVPNACRHPLAARKAMITSRATNKRLRFIRWPGFKFIAVALEINAQAASA